MMQVYLSDASCGLSSDLVLVVAALPDIRISAVVLGLWIGVMHGV